MARFWVSWESGNYTDEGVTQPPFQVWRTGEEVARLELTGRTTQTFVAVVDSETPSAVYQALRFHYPDFQVRFLVRVADGYAPPADRFPGFEGRTGLV